MGWLIAGVVVLLGITAGIAWTVREARNEARKRSISWWAARSGWLYSGGTDDLLEYFRGAPFDRGMSRDVQVVLRGSCGGRPALVVQFSWYSSPDQKQSKSTGTSGLEAGTAVAVVVELPQPVPEVVIRPQNLAGQIFGTDLDTESGHFNASYRVSTEVPRFGHAVVTPRLMETLLADRAYSVRLDGSMLAVWFEGRMLHGTEVAQLVSLAGRVVEAVPSFVFGVDWGGRPARSGPRTPWQDPEFRVAAIPAEAFGEVPAGSVAELRRGTYEGHEIEVYGTRPVLWGRPTPWVVAKLPVPGPLWPRLELIPRATVPNPAPDQPLVANALTAGIPEFDREFLISSGDPLFTRETLTPTLTSWLLADPTNRHHRFSWEYEYVHLDSAVAPVYRSVLSVGTSGTLTDDHLVTSLIHRVHALHEQLPPTLTPFKPRD